VAAEQAEVMTTALAAARIEADSETATATTTAARSLAAVTRFSSANKQNRDCGKSEKFLHGLKLLRKGSNGPATVVSMQGISTR
jgi:hypothetical protein